MRNDADLLPEGDWNTEGPQLLTTRQAAAHINVAADTIRVWTHRGLIHIAAWKHNGRRKYAMYDAADLAAVEVAMRQSPNCRRAA